MKKTINEVTIIVSISILIAVLYNLFSSKPIAWMREEIKIDTVATEFLLSLQDTNTISDITVEPEQKSEENKTTQDTTTVAMTEKGKTTEQTIKELIDSPSDGTFKTLTYNQVKENLNNPNIIFIDARPEEEWLEDKIGNAINIFPYSEDKDKYFKNLMSVPSDKVIVVYCSGGTCESSHKVVSDLLAFGFKRVFLYAGGWDEWIKKRGI